MAYEMNQLLEAMVENGASDLHISAGRPPSLRVSGEIVSVEGPALTPEQTKAMVAAILPPNQRPRFEAEGSCDFAFSFRQGVRLRVNAYRGNGGHGMVLRLLPSKMFTLEQLRLPPAIKDMLRRARGLILVTGPTGSGKSTTLASMINWINENEQGHIITIEDPIEYAHVHKNCLVTQREVGVDLTSFAEGLRSALRQDPDVILIGELRDPETIEAAITAAETGHLVLGTLHTSGAARTIDRIVDVFPAAEKEMVRAMLSESLVAVISQSLCKLKDGGGRIAAHEIMIGIPAIRNLIRENKVAQMYSVMQSSSAQGMQTLDQHLQSLVRAGLVSAEEARRHARYPENLR